MPLARNILLYHIRNSGDAQHPCRYHFAIPLIDYIQSAAKNLNPPPLNHVHLTLREGS